MKALLFPFFLTAAATAATAADTPVITGNLQIHNSIAGNESEISCSVAQKDLELTGTCSSDQGTVNIGGKVDGKNVYWTYKSEYNGGPITLTYKGKVESAEKITGSVTVEEYSVDGDFTATLSK